MSHSVAPALSRCILYVFFFVILFPPPLFVHNRLLLDRWTSDPAVMAPGVNMRRSLLTVSVDNL